MPKHDAGPPHRAWAVHLSSVKVCDGEIIRFSRLDGVKPAIAILGKLAMADIFLIALYVVLAKGVGVGRVEIG